MTLKARIQFAIAYSLPALLVTAWFVTDAHSNWIGLYYGEVIFVAMIVIPVWMGMFYAETRYRLTHYYAMPVIPLLSIAYPPLYLAFFFIAGYFQGEVDKLDLVDANGYASSVGLVIGAWAWFGLVLLSFILLCLIPGRKPPLTSIAEQIMDGNHE